jgi:hypothetical protein
MIYKITKDNEDGSRELVKTVEGTEEEAKSEFLEVIKTQSHEYHVTKQLKKWRTIRLLDETGKQIAQES